MLLSEPGMTLRLTLSPFLKLAEVPLGWGDEGFLSGDVAPLLLLPLLSPSVDFFLQLLLQFVDRDWKGEAWVTVSGGDGHWPGGPTVPPLLPRRSATALHGFDRQSAGYSPPSAAFWTQPKHFCLTMCQVSESLASRILDEINTTAQDFWKAASRITERIILPFRLLIRFLNSGINET